MTKPVDYLQLIRVVENLVLPDSGFEADEPILLNEAVDEDHEKG